MGFWSGVLWKYEGNRYFDMIDKEGVENYK